MNRVAIYTRVSSEEQLDGYSLEAQSQMCHQFAQMKGWTVVRIYEERGRSGKTIFRPEFQQMLLDAQAGQFDILVVHKLDRFSRSLIDIFTKLNELQSFGVSFVSSSEQFDFTSPFGKVILAILAAFAQWYVENLANETKKGKKQRAMSGDWNGTLSTGYTTPKRLQAELITLGESFKHQEITEEHYEVQAKLIEDALEHYSEKHDTAAIPSPILGKAIQIAFQTYADGLHSDNDIAWLLNDQHYRTSGQFGRNLFSKDTVRDLLQSRFYIGETSYKGEWIQGAHEPLISKELWDRCQMVRLRRAEKINRGAYNSSEDYPLASLLVCLDCGTRYHGWTLRGERRYRDPFRQFGRHCNNVPKSIPAIDLEKQVEDILFDLKIPTNWKDLAKTVLTEEPKNHDEERSRLTARLERLKRLYLAGDFSDKEYDTKKKEIQEQLLMLPVSHTISTMEITIEHLSQTQQLWYAATPDERKEWLQYLFQTLYVENGKIVAAEATSLLWEIIRFTFDMRNGDDGVRTRTTYLVSTGLSRSRVRELAA